MTEPCDLPAIAARRLIGSKKLSPVELLESCIGRIEAVDHAVNAIPARDFDRARQAAKRAEAAVMRGERLPALHGLPVVIKDLEDAEGLVNSQGSPIYRDDVKAADQRSVAAVRAAGAIIVGKSNVPEFGAGANSRNRVYGATGNAFDPSKNAAGSSGGSAVALACGMVPLATGSDTGGSLRNPAAFNGIVGFRPTPGLVPNERSGHGWSALSVLGPMARNVPDAALLLSAMVSDDARDPLATTIHGRTVRAPEEFYPLPEVDLASLRVALTPDFGLAPTERQVADAFREKTGLFRGLFARADDAYPDCTGADESFEVLRSLGFLSKHAEHVRTRPDDLGPNIHANYEEGLRYSSVDVARALAIQTQHYRRWQAFFGEYHLVLSPAMTTVPRPWSELYPAEIDGKSTRTYFHWLALSYYVSLAGHPALCLPLGLDAGGMPFGLQIVGPRGGDAFVLAAAAALERALDGDARTRRPVPDLEKLKRGAADPGDGGVHGAGMMLVLDHAGQALEQWREGVQTRMIVSALTGSSALCVFEQFVAPGQGAPAHTHTVEEVLTVVAGVAEIAVGEERRMVGAGGSVVIPAGRRHGFVNSGADRLHVQAILAAPYFEAAFEDRTEVQVRWHRGKVGG